MKIKIGGEKIIREVWDFGFPPYPQNEIELDSKLWEEFVDARHAYEYLYDDIKKMFENKGRKLFCEKCYKFY